MPLLNFKGKSIVRTHHLNVPYRQLVPHPRKSVLPAKGKPSLDDNLIIHGDNLEALKALLPSFSGRIKCIYIDPPYNTGNERWVYNDNVNSPMHRDWLKRVVDKDDLTRHDKWLCMMWPRLTLLRELLTEDGAIFISIDDNEVHHLRAVMDEIFGETNFIACVVARLNPRGRTLDRFLAKTYEYVLVYGKDSNKDTTINLLEKEGAQLEDYDQEDERGKYRELELRNRNPVFNRQNRPNLFFPIYIDPKTNKVSLEPSKKYSVEALPRNSKGEDGCWTWGDRKVKQRISELTGRQVSTGEWRVFRKDYLYDEEGEVATTKAKALWLDKAINNENGKEVSSEIFGAAQFDFPKSVDLVKKCLELGSTEDAIILDSFAGSGTTAHTVLALNAEDGGNRRFILVEQEDYADTITAERVRRVIKGVPNAKDEKLQQGYGGSFSYFTLGPRLDDDGILQGDELPAYKDLARYVFFTATGEQWDESQLDEGRFYIGESKRYHVYLIYQPSVDFIKNTPLNLDFAMALPPYTPNVDKLRLVIASHKYLDDDRLREFGIEFCQLPFSIYKFRA